MGSIASPEPVPAADIKPAARGLEAIGRPMFCVTGLALTSRPLVRIIIEIQFGPHIPRCGSILISDTESIPTHGDRDGPAENHLFVIETEGGKEIEGDGSSPEKWPTFFRSLRYVFGSIESTRPG